MNHPNVNIRCIDNTKHSIHLYDPEFSISIIVDTNDLNLMLGLTMDRFSSLKESILGMPLDLAQPNLKSSFPVNKVE